VIRVWQRAAVHLIILVTPLATMGNLTSVIVMAVNEIGKATSTPSTLVNFSKTATQDGRAGKAILGFGVLFFGCGGRLRISNGHASLFAPLWMYDISVKTFWWVNWGIGAACYCLNVHPGQTSPDWNVDKNLSVESVRSSPDALDAKSLEDVRLSIVQDKNGQLKERNLIQLFDSLPAANPEDMRGTAFRGRVVRSGRFLDIPALLLIPVVRLFGVQWGKRYRTQYVGDPLCGTFLGRFHFPIPIWGNVGMHGVNYRGVERATMAYDHQPWHDMFALLDDGSISGRKKFLGNWCHRTKCGGWFTLEQLPDIDVSL